MTLRNSSTPKVRPPRSCSSMIATLSVCIWTLGASLYSRTASQPRCLFIPQPLHPTRPRRDDTAGEGSDDLFGGHHGTVAVNPVEEQSDRGVHRPGAGTVRHVETVSGTRQFDVSDRRVGHPAPPLDEALRLRDGYHAVAGSVHHQERRRLGMHARDRRRLAEQIAVLALLLVDHH